MTTTTTIANEDALLAIEVVARRLRLTCDPLQSARALGSADLVVHADGEIVGLGRAIGALGMEARWLTLATDPGSAVWIAKPTADSPMHDAVLVGLGRRGLRYDVAICRRGVATRRRMTAAALRRALGIATDDSIGALVVGVGAPLAALADPHHTMTPWQRVRRLVQLERSDIAVTIVYSIAIGVLSLVLPIAAQALVTTVAFGSVLQPLLVLTVLFAIGAAAAGVLQLMQAWIVEVIQQRVFGRAVADVARRLVGMPYSVLDRVHVPDLINRFFEVPTIQKALSTVLVAGVGLVLQTLLGLTLLGFYHPLLLAFALVLLVLLVLVIFVVGRGAVSSALDESKAKYRAVGWLEHLARIPTAFKSASGRRLALIRADRLVRVYLDARRRHFRKLLLQSGGGIALAVLGPTVLLGLGGLLVLRNQLTLGQLVAAELVMASLSVALVKLGKQLESVYDLAQATTKLGLLIDLPAERRGGELLREPTPQVAASLRAHDLSFAHGGTTVLPRVAVDAPAGTRLAVRGPGGVGKSTLLELLASLRNPTGGNVELDGCDLRLLDLDAVRESVMLVRGAEFIDGSIADNLRLLRQHAAIESLESVIAAVGLQAVIRALPEGLATAMRPSGAPLSSSQQRRLALARALVASPRVLLLDGTLDGLGVDRPTKLAILDHVLSPTAPWTVVVVTEDDDVVSRCTGVLRLGPAEQANET